MSAAVRSIARPAALPGRSCYWDGTLAALKFTPCEQKPLAVLDVDETALLNLGYEASDAQRQGPHDEKRWERWSRPAPTR